MLSDVVDHKTVASALIRGQECNNDVEKMINDGHLPPKSLVNTVRDSISVALSFVYSIGPPPPDQASSSRPMAKKTRPVHKRSPLKKNICGKERYREFLSPCIDDGFIWRKYGSKIIKGTPHKRNYFRCYFEKTRNCEVTRRVQKIQEDPLLYKIFYDGQHTCNNPVFSDHVYHDTMDRANMLCFGRHDQPVSDLVLQQPLSNDQQKTIRVEVITDHNMTLESDITSDLVLPQSVLIDQQKTIQAEATDHIMTLVSNTSEFLMNDDQSENIISGRFLNDLLRVEQEFHQALGVHVM